MDWLGKIGRLLCQAVTNVLRPDQDPRRNIEPADDRIIETRPGLHRKLPEKEEVSNISELDDAQINIIYNDCVAVIKGHKEQLWKIFTWSTAVLAAIAGFSVANSSILGSFFGVVGISCILMFAGAVGIYLLNEESVMLERNRYHLAAIRACMRPIVQNIYLDREAGKNCCGRRASMKRSKETAMRAIIFLWTFGLIIFLVLFPTINADNLTLGNINNG